MAREVVEVVARFAGTIIDLAHLGPDESYRIGTAPGNDLAVPGLTCFPLVDRGVVRCPIGMQVRDPAELDAALVERCATTAEPCAATSELRSGAVEVRSSAPEPDALEPRNSAVEPRGAVEPGGILELRAGALELRVTRTRLPPRTLPPPRVELRTPAFVLASLIVHLAIWLAAERFAAFERLAPPRLPLRLAHIAVRLDEPPQPRPEPTPPTPKSTPKPTPKAKPEPRARALAASTVRDARDARDARAGRRERGARHGRAKHAEATLDPSQAIAHLLDQMPDLESPEYADAFDAEHFHDPGSDDTGSFGAGNALVPNEREGWGTIASGPYTLLPIGVKLCPAGACTVRGPIPPLYVRTHLLAHIDAIYECYTTLAPGPGTIVLELTIGADGVVHDARGSGLGETGACAARIASSILFRALGAETRVRYPVQFK